MNTYTTPQVDLTGLKILSRPHPDDRNSLLLFTNRDLWVTPALMQQMNGICGQYMQHLSTLHTRMQLDRRLLECLNHHVDNVSLTPLPGWSHMAKATDMKDFLQKWERANGDVSDIEVKPKL